MKKLITKVDDIEEEVIIERDEFMIGESTFRIIEQTPLATKIQINGDTITVDEVIHLPDEGVYRVEIRGYTIDVKVIDPISEALQSSAGASGEVISPMAGTISSIEISEGEEVSEGQVLLVISAMKMENQITSPVSGIVQNVKVNNNEQVPSGKLLVVVKPREKA